MGYFENTIHNIRKMDDTELMIIQEHVKSELKIKLNSRLGDIAEMGRRIHEGIERKFKIKDRIEWLLRNCNDEDKEYYSNFKISGIVEDISDDLKEENLEPTIENIDSAFEGLWE